MKYMATFFNYSNFTLQAKSILILSINVSFGTPSVCSKDKLVVHYRVLEGEDPPTPSPALHI